MERGRKDKERRAAVISFTWVVQNELNMLFKYENLDHQSWRGKHSSKETVSVLKPMTSNLPDTSDICFLNQVYTVQRQKVLKKHHIIFSLQYSLMSTHSVPFPSKKAKMCLMKVSPLYTSGCKI